MRKVDWFRTSWLRVWPLQAVGSVQRQVIVSARKAADAVIGQLGNGDVAAAVLQAIRYGGEVLVSAKASGIVVDSRDFESIQQPCLYCI